MIHKFHFNADLQEVWKRLGEKFNAPLAQLAEQTIRTRPTGVQVLNGAPLEQERE